MDSKVQQLFPHVLNAIIDSPNQEISLADIVEFIQGIFQLENLQIDVEEVEQAIQKGIEFGLIIDKNDVFGITFNPFLSNERNRRSLENLSSEEKCQTDTWSWKNEKPILIDSEDESECESDFSNYSAFHSDIIRARKTQYPINSGRSRVQVRKRNANSKSNRYKKAKF